ncbi:50S ribosomal protein L29 [Candidatus Woesearchaeota archaeon]|jgi:large subunit ribosomal protein L29|nr:50S ribosomal protein L29 [Candidatus Woesearchaeota archaeon]MBT4387749.1 50S ribosomal protein L29 [Candidatus Woesearchaeota archaeon]MBT4595568.1 50S ribosomal protein L29 [Candidatus Woesearchaeota archaeon]MBT5740949.1 50S ribosomal protein L29 [Candidatus Woesearchaeota archaeon]MBT7296501.1 50S ribosomal protein L29 [Candidatus Woesearchaeota archaeon]
MKFRDLKSISDADLGVKIVELEKELLKVNGQIAQGSGIKNTSQRRELKRSIAKIMTLTNQRKKSDSKISKKTAENKIKTVKETKNKN